MGHSYGCYLVNRLASEDGSGRIAAVVCIGAGFPLPGAFRMRWIFLLPTIVSSHRDRDGHLPACSCTPAAGICKVLARCCSMQECCCRHAA